MQGAVTLSYQVFQGMHANSFLLCSKCFVHRRNSDCLIKMTYSRYHYPQEGSKCE